MADTAYQGGGPAIRVPQRRRRLDPATGRYRRLSQAQKQANAAHARRRGSGERANAMLKGWKILRKIRSSPDRATTIVQAVQTLILAHLINLERLNAALFAPRRATARGNDAAKRVVWEPVR